MNITLYTDPDVTGSTYIMCVDLSFALQELGHDVTIVTAIGKIAETRPDLLINLIPKDVIKLQKQAGRYFYCGSMITLFSPGLSIFSRPQIGYMLLSALETPIIAHSPAIHKDLIHEASTLLSPAINRKVRENLTLIPYGVGPDYEFKKREDLTWFVAPFTRAVADHKRFPLHSKTTVKTNVLLKKNGFDMKTAFYASSGKLSHTEGKDLSAYEVRDIILDRKAYARELQKFAFAISTSDYESFGLYYVELLMSGVVVLFSDYPWVQSLLPGYKWVAKDADLPALALYVRKNYDEVFDDIQNNVLPFIRENYTISKFAKELLKKCVS